MKNNSMYITLAAVIAFIAAAAYAILFYFGILPPVTVFAATGIAISLIVLVLLTLARFLQRSNNSNKLHNSFAEYGRAVIFAAVVCLCVSVLALTIPAAISVLYTTILLLMVFFWKFLVITWGLLLCGTMPANNDHCCHIHNEQCNDTDTTSNNSVCGYCNSNKYNY